MELGLSETRRLLVDTVRRFVAAELRPLEAEVAQSGRLDPGKAKAILAKSRALGLYAMRSAIPAAPLIGHNRNRLQRHHP